jgi:predicted metal-dependent phosphoesterase TrpH
MSHRMVQVELHCHTVHSMDGLMTYESLIDAARRVGLDAVAITDHDTLDGALAFRKRALDQQSPLEIIPGEEKTLADGSHFIGLFLERPIQSGDLAGAIAEIEGQGGLCLVPHPFRRKDGLFRDGLERAALLEGRAAGFELFSAKCSFAENTRAQALLTQTGLGPFGGSDAHYECDLGEALNVVEWAGDWRTTLQRMLERRAPLQILAKAQSEGAPERRYAPLYYQVKKYLRLPQAWVPAARQGYRHYRNWKFGIGRKPLREAYRHA